ncbi:MAG: hypothetical protein KDE68_05430 [Rhodocyclaceae bacterium]|nr:hypothetical protein [Rhodocyclaceae bacterium]
MALFAALAGAAEPLPSPAGAAYLKAERHRIERQFVSEVAGIAGVAESVVRQGMPDGPRITDTGQRVIATIEQRTGRVLADGQRAQIEAADARRKAALVRARDAASQR